MLPNSGLRRIANLLLAQWIVCRSFAVWAVLLVIGGLVLGCDVPEKLRGPKRFKEAARIEYDESEDGQGEARSVRLKFITLNESMLDDMLQNQTLESVEFNECRRESVPLLRKIAALPRLRELMVNHVALDDDELADLANCTNLKAIELSQNGIDGSGMLHLAHLPIERVALRGQTLTTDGLKSVLAFENLQDLEIFSTNLDANEVPNLSGLTSLKIIRLHRLQFNYREDGGLKCLEGCKPVELEISGSRINKRVFDAIGKLTSLKRLRVANSFVTDEGLESLASLTELEWLRLDQCQNLTEEALVSIAKLKKLTDVTLDGTMIRGNRLDAIATMPQLKRIELRGRDLDEEAVRQFESLSRESGILLMHGDALAYMRRLSARMQSQSAAQASETLPPAKN